MWPYVARCPFVLDGTPRECTEEKSTVDNPGGYSN